MDPGITHSSLEHGTYADNTPQTEYVTFLEEPNPEGPRTQIMGF